ncbi:hypothetical protein Tco_0461449 [Tanacetum coccineum]
MGKGYKKLIDAKVELVHMILNEIGNDIYSTVDACLMQRKCGKESLSTFMKTKLFWKFGKYTSRDGNQLRHTIQEWSKFVTIVKQAHNLDNVSYRKLFDIIKQHQNEVNDFRAKRTARNSNSLALVTATQHYPDTYPQAPQAPKPYKTQEPSSRQITSTKSHDSIKNKGKEIVKAPSPPFESTSKEDSDEEQA